MMLRWKVLGLAYNRRKTRNKRPLVRDPDRSWCHRHMQAHFIEIHQVFAKNKFGYFSNRVVYKFNS